jgi:hypothetical protein
MFTKYRLVEDYTIRHDAMCGNVPDIEAHETSFHGYSPNDISDDEAYEYWMGYADYFQWPFVTVFNDWDDLFIKLKTLDLRAISEQMDKFNMLRQTDLLENWCKILKSLPDDRNNVPKSFQDGIKYFKMSFS